MSDNEMILTLQNEVFAAVNASKMPLAVKSLVLENALMKVNAAMQAEKERQAAEATEAPAEQTAEEGAGNG